MKTCFAILLALVSCGRFVRAEDATERLRSAVDAVPDGGVVRIEKGEYHFYAGHAAKMTLSPSNNTRGEKQVLFPIVGRKDLTIDGGGSTFILHGDVFPFAVTNCCGITLRNFTMKTSVPPVAEFAALAKTDEGALIEFAEDAPRFEHDRILSLHSLQRLMIRYLVPGASAEPVANLPAAFIRADLEPREGRRALLRYSAAEPRGIDYPFDVGERVVVNLAANRERLSFFFQDCSDVKIEDVRLPRGAGMGVVAQRCRNVTLRNFDVEPENGEGVSLTADIVQLINCCGSVLIEDCEMSGSLDDAINIHGNYLALESVDGGKVTLRTKHEQHAGFFPYRVGDELEFVEPKRREVRAKAKVVSIDPDPKDVTLVTLALDRAPVAEAVKGTIVENATLNPDVTIRNCRFRDIPHVRLSGRGKYLVEDNLFVRCNEAVCAMDLADYWYESGRISEMTIRGNTVIESGGFRVGVAGWNGDEPDLPKVHGRIVIRDNRFVKPRWQVSVTGAEAAEISVPPETRIYRTTFAQDFREVYNADWSKLSTGPGAQIIDLDGAKPTHRFRGLGGSFAECSGFLFARMPEAKRAQLMEMLFGKTGLRLSTGRIHCASSDYSMHIYSYDDVDGDTELKRFSIDDDRRYVLPMIKAAQKMNPDIFFFSSPWSAPWWMKRNRAVSVGHLRDDMYGIYADYIVKFLQAYAEEGVDIKAHSPQNEPGLGDGPDVNAMNSPTMIMSPEEEAKLILALKPRFDRAGLATKIWMFDHSYCDTNHVDKALAVPGVREAVGGIAWHSYGGDPEAVARYRREFPELENIHTEQGPSVDRSERNFLYWGERMLRGFNAGLSGYTNWLLLTDENGQPNTSCGHPCAGLVALHSETGELIPSNQYQAFRHVSPYVMPGAEVLEAPPVNSVPGVLAATRIKDTETSAFRNPDGSHVVVINHRDDIGAQIVIKLHDAYLPVILLPKSLVTVVIR